MAFLRGQGCWPALPVGSSCWPCPFSTVQGLQHQCASRCGGHPCAPLRPPLAHPQVRGVCLCVLVMEKCTDIGGVDGLAATQAGAGTQRQLLQRAVPRCRSNPTCIQHAGAWTSEQIAYLCVPKLAFDMAALHAGTWTRVQTQWRAASRTPLPSVPTTCSRLPNHAGIWTRAQTQWRAASRMPRCCACWPAWASASEQRTS